MEKRSLDQSKEPDGDQPSEYEGVQDDSPGRRLFYTSDKAGRKTIRKLESFEIEEDLFDDDMNHKYEYTTQKPQDKDNSRIKKNSENGEELESNISGQHHLHQTPATVDTL